MKNNRVQRTFLNDDAKESFHIFNWFTEADSLDWFTEMNQTCQHNFSTELEMRDTIKTQSVWTLSYTENLEY